MSTILAAGFSYWGLFVVLALILVGYGLWMRWVERTDEPTEETRAAAPSSADRTAKELDG